MKLEFIFAGVEVTVARVDDTVARLEIIFPIQPEPHLFMEMHDDKNNTLVVRVKQGQYGGSLCQQESNHKFQHSSMSIKNAIFWFFIE